MYPNLFNPPEKVEPEKYAIEPEAPDWWLSSMETLDRRVHWLKDIKFGMFVHWGAYSLPAGVWKGEAVMGYSEHLMNLKRIPLEEYRSEVVGKFNPVHFDPDGWIRLCRDAGMKYFVITAKHHDGLAMYESEVSEYNVVKATPWGFDPMPELKQACLKYGIKFGLYYSHSQDWSEPYGLRNNWDFPDNPAFPQWHQCEKWQHFKPLYHKYITGKAIPQVRELIRKYDPDLMWFDTAFWMPKEESLSVLQAVREEKPSIVVNSRISATSRLFGDYKCTNDQPVDYPRVPYDIWEGIPTTNNSYGFHQKDNNYKTSKFLMELLLKAIERGGRLLLNVGPCADGQIDINDDKILKEIGNMMNKSGEGVHYTSSSPLPLQSCGHITVKGNKVYMHVTEFQLDGKVIVSGIKNKISKVYLTSDSALLNFTENKNFISIEFDVDKSYDSFFTVVLEAKNDIEVIDNASRMLLSNMSKQFFHVFDCNAYSDGITFGSGCLGDNYVGGFSGNNSFIEWNFNVCVDSVYDIVIIYVSEEKDGGDFVVKIGDSEFCREVKQGKIFGKTEKKYQEHYLGKVHLKCGENILRIESKKVIFQDLFHLKGVQFLQSLSDTKKSI